MTLRAEAIHRRHDGSDGVRYWSVPRSTLVVGVWQGSDRSWYWSTEDETDWRENGGPVESQRQARVEGTRTAMRRIARRIGHADNMRLIEGVRMTGAKDAR